MSKVVLKVEDLWKKYIISNKPKGDLRAELGSLFRRKEDAKEKTFWALQAIDFEVRKGDIIGIIGNNGAGKSTLLKIISRITLPTKGRIEIEGRVASLLEVGTGFHPELSGRENIYLNGSILGMKRREITNRLEEIIDFAGVTTFIDTPVKHYSSGMFMRLAFSVAAHLNADILLIDEVLAVGDVAFQKKCLGKMGEVAKEGKTVLMVSHNMGAIRKLSEKTILLNKGKLQNIGFTNRVINSYLDSIKEASTELVFSENHKEIYIQSLKLTNAKGKTMKRLLFGEPFGIELQINAKIDLTHGTIALGINTIFGERIFTSISDHKKFEVNFQKNRSNTIKIHFEELILHPGNYGIYLSLRKGKYQEYDTVTINNFFSILEAPYKKGLFYEGHWGILRINPNWEWVH